jgi:hypothetical protein
MTRRRLMPLIVPSRLAHGHAAAGTWFAGVVRVAAFMFPAAPVVPSLIVASAPASIVISAPAPARVVSFRCAIVPTPVRRDLARVLLDAGGAGTGRPYQGREGGGGDAGGWIFHGAMFAARV